MMSEKSVDSFRTEIDILSLDIENLDEASKIQVLKHLEETIKILKLGSSLNFETPPAKRMKIVGSSRTLPEHGSQTDFREMLLKEEAEDLIPGIDQEFIKNLYNGMVPKCEDCGETFQTLGGLDNHLKIHLKPKNISGNKQMAATRDSSKKFTNSCNSLFKDGASLLKNTSTSNSLKEEDGISNESLLKESISVLDSKQESFKCDSCDKKFSSKRNMFRHRLVHTDKYECKTCQHRFSQGQDLVVHNRNPDSCKRYLALGDHIKLEGDEKPIRTKEVNNEDTPKETLVKHLDFDYNAIIKSPEITEETLFKCNSCLREFSNKKSYNNHQIVHTDKYVCPICKHRFGRRKDLEIHTKNKENCKKYLVNEIVAEVKEELVETSIPAESSNIESFSCSKCDRRYHSRRRLQEHSNVHTDKYKCTTCHHRFSAKREFEGHIRNPDNCKKFLRLIEGSVSRTEQTFNCRECDAILMSNDSFEIHMMKHEDETNQEGPEELLQCDFCYKNFASSISFQSHMESHEVNIRKNSINIPDLILDTTR